MKPLVLAVAALLGFSGPIPEQQMMKNPSRPPAADAGRPVSPQKEWTIEETGDGYFLTNPLGLKFGPDGSLYVQDINKILRFDANGRFLRTYKPASASEQVMFFGIDITGENVVTFDRSARRVHVFDLETAAERTFTIPGSGRPTTHFLFCRNNRLYFSDPQKIFSYSPDGQAVGPEIPIPTEQAETTEGASRKLMTVVLRATPTGENGMMLCSSSDYVVRHVDLGSGKIVGAFAREYDRVKNENVATSALAPYVNDISALHLVGDRVWVFTSTFDPARGTLVDVFDLHGRYLDNFYLQIKDGESALRLGANKALSGRNLVVVQRRSAAFAISKYTLPAGS